MSISGKPYGINPATGLMEPLANISGLSNIYFVRVATTASLNATYNSGAKTLTNAGTNAALSIDGVTLSAADKVLVKNQSTGTQNGLYTVTTVGDGSTSWVLTRSEDMDTATEAEERDWFWVTEGATNADNGFALSTPGSITLDSTSLTFTRMLGSSTGSGQPASAALTDWDDVGVVSGADKYPYSTGAGVWTYGTITAAGRAILDDADATAQRTTLGLGSAAVLNTGTSSGTVPVLGLGGALPAVSGANLTSLPGTGVVNVQTFTADGTWTKPAGGTFARVICIGGGGGGGSGALNSASTGTVYGGGAGAGGAYAEATILLSALSSTEAVTVGAGGAGGAAITYPSTGSGNAGTAGEDTTFGSHVLARGGAGGNAASGTNGTTGATASTGGTSTITIWSGGNGGASASPFSAGSAAPFGGGGGGSAGRYATSGSSKVYGQAGGAGGTSRNTSGGTAGAAGTIAGGYVAATDGSSSANYILGGGGGGGGAGTYNDAGVSPDGGDGALYGGGGGGGGPTRVANSGTGGAGAAGVCVVIVY